jgi:hypothetical protein
MFVDDSGERGVYFQDLRMEAARYSARTVNMHQTTECHIPKGMVMAARTSYIIQSLVQQKFV